MKELWPWMRLFLQPRKQRGEDTLLQCSVCFPRRGNYLAGVGAAAMSVPHLAATPVCHHGQEFEVSSAWEGSWTDRGPLVLWLIPPQWFFIGCITT